MIKYLVPGADETRTRKTAGGAAVQSNSTVCPNKQEKTCKSFLIFNILFMIRRVSKCCLPSLYLKNQHI